MCLGALKLYDDAEVRRMTLSLDEQLLAEVRRESGEKSASAAIRRAMEAYVRIPPARQALGRLRGSGAWEGDLADMREDRSRRVPRRTKR